jgi:ParB family transcriptional regulator, chromosome partitioning protein
MQRKKSGLGRGLDALIPGGEEKLPRDGIIQVLVENVQPNPRQPRTFFDTEELAELAASIKEHGIIQPLIVAAADSPDKFILIAGERRLQAAKQAGLQHVPVLIRDASAQQFLELALIENIQRADLNPLEAAEAYRQLSEEFHLSHDQIATQVGKSRTAITNTLRLLKLPASIQQTLVDRKISEGHARAILALPTSQAQLAVLATIVKNELNVRQTEELIRKYLGHKPVPASKPEIPPEIKTIEDRLRSFLGTKVRVNHGKQGGSITIHYYSNEELEGILDRIIKE